MLLAETIENCIQIVHNLYNFWRSWVAKIATFFMSAPIEPQQYASLFWANFTKYEDKQGILEDLEAVTNNNATIGNWMIIFT